MLKERNHKIVMLIPSFFPNKMGGSEIQAFRLSEKLMMQGQEVIIFTLNKGHLAKYENVQGINVTRLSGTLLIIPRCIQFLQTRIPFLRKKVRREVLEEYGSPNDAVSFLLAKIFYTLCLRELKEQKIMPSIIQVNTVEWVSVSGALLAQKLKVPLLIKDSTVNGLAKLKLMPFVRKYRRWIIDRAFFVAISSVIKKQLLEQGVTDQKIFTISNGIEIIDPSNGRKGVAPNSCLFVGNLYQEPAKGFSILIDAWSFVVKDVGDAVLNVVGDGDIEQYKEQIKIRKLDGHIVFWGKQADVKKFYCSNEIFVLSSIREGMSNSLIEAMSHGIPCVSTMVSGSTDLLQHMDSGLLVQPKSPLHLAEAVVFLFRNKHLHRDMGTKAKESVKRLCDINVVSAQYRRVYDTMCQPNPVTV